VQLIAQPIPLTQKPGAKIHVVSALLTAARYVSRAHSCEQFCSVFNAEQAYFMSARWASTAQNIGLKE
jgi:hypothetical protein